MRSEHDWPIGVALAVLAALGVAVVTPAATSAHPPDRTDHGVPDRTFHALWSGDTDAVDDQRELAASGETAMAELAAGTDVPLDSPPAAVAAWNSGELDQFPTTTRSVSVHPPDATLTDGRFLRDAHASVFTVQPATRARLSPSRQPLYVATDGTLLGTVDYRVVVPENTSSEDRRVSWRLESHGVETTRVLVDGRVETNASGSRTPALPYTLSDASGRGRTRALTLESEIAVRFRKEVETCTEHDDDGECTEWRTSITHPSENVTVRDSIGVVPYDLQVSGFVGRFPNGELGLVVYKSEPWLGATLPNGDVRGVWRFYAARDQTWDTLISSRTDRESTFHSPLHPLRVTAYPIEPGPTPTPRGDVTILDAYGTTRTPPTLPSTVHLDALDRPYTASYGIATRAATTGRLPTVRAWGLVRDAGTAQSLGTFTRVQIHRSTLTLAVRNTTDDSVTVRVRLRDRDSRTPIDTADREGYVVVDGRQINTSDDGTATVTLARPPGGVSARYVPGQWWRNHPAFVGDSATVLVRRPILDVLGSLYRVGVPVALFLLAGFLIDRFTGWRLWPPWRRL